MEVKGVPQPAPAPRFSRTPGAVRGAPRRVGEDTVEALMSWGFSGEELTKLLEAGAVLQVPPAGDRPGV